ncbi:non-ribosomal peptide synthetase [Longimicrobium sp.]|uniref:non-ribosomal peptide synthetase n=1 Tax=Longimicrobium sp. TaxID=2029185 RepID=UPI002C038D1E|nr:non-ribosomal peptide synthetase [Longimicrobium sp.]HSU17577.1 amino acid adenylation domain-containing protein [Longimicrobium sp.]
MNRTLTAADREKLLKKARAAKLERSWPTLAPIEPADRGGRLALSFAQQRLWFLEQLGDMGSTYHVRRALRLKGELDRDALGRALDRIVARHEALRTTFAVVDGEPEQRIHADGAFHLREHDLRGDGDAEAELRRLAAEESEAPFDLARGPLIRGRLVRMGEADHVLLLTLHHVVADAWSMGVLVNELSALYAAFRAGGADPLPPLPVQYADYAVWQRKWVDGDVLRQQGDYWKTALAGAPALLELPTDHPRPARQEHAGATVPVELDEALTAAVKALAQRHGTTLFMTLLAAWSVVLARLSGQGDLVLGTPSANRARPEIEGLIGFFLNTLALRVDLSDAPTVAGLLARVKDRALEAQQNQDIPFEQVVELVQPARSLAHTPVFQVMFTWANAPRSTLSLSGLELSSVASAQQETAKFDLSLDLQETGGRIAGRVEYATALFERATIERWTGYLRRALEEMAADDSVSVARIDLLPAAERRMVVEEWNRTSVDFPAGECIHQIFQARAAAAPEAEAVVWQGESLSYGELNARANRLAHHLRALGVGPDVRVGLSVERGMEMMVGVLAVLKAGGAYVPLDPSYPHDRLRYMLDDSGAAVLLTQPSLAGVFAGIGVHTVDLMDPAAWAGAPGTDPERGGLRADHLAYVIYTSGSTGQPKGVMIEHGSIANAFRAWEEPYELGTRARRHLQMASFSFDVFTGDWTRALCSGGTLVLCPRELLLEAERLYALMVTERVDTAEFVPAVLRELIRHLAATGATLDFMRLVICGSDTWSVGEYRHFLSFCGPDTRLVNSFGLTEAAIDSTWFEARSLDGFGAEQHVPIGRPFANTTLYILDAHGQPAPIGVAGELYVGGRNLARGYHGRPELTAEKFVRHPFDSDPRARVYRTGDGARWRADGNVEFLGRIDNQVKVRGFRVELAEIEARLAEHPAVSEAIVAARPSSSGDPRLIAWWLGDDAEPEALRAHLSRHLPDYMVPAAYVRLDALPLTPNGKVDRKALPEPGVDAFAARAYEAPVGQAETAVAEIWRELLGVERVGRMDGFFELGGHSLRAMQVISRVRQALGVEASVGDLFARPVLADFARGLGGAARAELPPVTAVAGDERLALSFAQQRLWFLEQMGSAGAAYHIPLRVRLRGDLHRLALERALDRIVARHEALRTTFTVSGGQPRQRIAPAGESAFRLVDHDLRHDADAEAGLRRLIAEEARARFDLERGPLVRGRLVRLADDDHVLLLTLHHVAGDGWSTGVLTDELSALYRAFVAGEGDPLPPLAVQYADYAAWQRRWMDGPVLEAQAAYWTRALAGAPEVLALPADRARPARQDHAGASARVELDEALAEGLKELSRRHGATLFMTLMAGWAATLGRLAGQDDVVVGTPTANRGSPEIEGLIGFFVNTLALRVDLSGSPTVAELLGRVRARSLEAQDNQDIPFEQVVERVQPVRSLSHSPLFQVLFTWQNAPGGRLDLAGLEPAALPFSSAETSKYDLSLSLHESGGRIVGRVEYATALFDAPTVERFLGYFRRVLEGMVADAAQPVERIALLPEDERRQVVEGWNATDAEYPRTSCLHHLFEAQVERTPDATALTFEGDSITYRELNARANRLAHHLIARGVGPDVRVGLCVERSMEMMVGLIGILKAGGAYVALDPEYPEERLRYMLGDSEPAVLLTNGAASDRFGGLDVPVVALDRDAAMWAEAPETNPDRAVTPNNLAYLIYTSGSTGQPKGVMVEHRSVVNVLAWMNASWQLDSTDVVLQKTPYSFDASLRELIPALLVGARMVIARPGGHRDPTYMLETIRRERVTTLHFVPTMLAVLVQEPEFAASCTDLKRVVCGGEPLPAELVKRFHQHLPNTRLYNVYGPTEAAVDVTEWSCAADDERDRIPIGRPMANVRMYVLDADGQPVPAGVVGELYIGGVQVARGYNHRPELTAERFVADPFSGEPGARLYRTGDLGRWLPEGAIEVLGRADAQVKVRGFRIELGEIESRLAEHPQIRETVVIAREDSPGDRRLVAYYVGDSAIDADALRTHLGEHLPEHMVPAAYVALDELPRTPNGKLDRRALPAPEGDAFARRGFEAPESETEQALAEIWSDVLGISAVGRRDHFFELGGHSLLAVQVISRVRQVLGVEAALGDVFERPVLADFARALSTAAHADLPPIEVADRDRPLALSFAQQRLWFLEQLGGMDGAYHVPNRLRLQGELDRDALVRALERIVARHEVLRTSFALVDGEPVQRIAPAEGFRLRVREQDLSGNADPEAALRRLTTSEGNAPFDLEMGPLIRARLVRMAADDHVLMVTTHHIVSDAWSTGVLVRELGALYGAFHRGEPDPLPPLAVQYADYAAWQRRWVDGEVLKRQADYWKQTLAGAPERLELPADRPRPARQDHAGALVAVELDERLTAALKSLGQRHGTTLFMTLMAGWATVLARLSGQRDVVIGTPTANRGRREIEGLIGFFVNTLALRVDLDGEPSVAGLLRRVKARALEAQQNQDIPFEQVVELAQPVRSLSHSPLFQVMFAWQNAGGSRLELPGLRLARAGSSAHTTAKFDLSLTLTERGGRIAGSLEYATALFDAATVERHVGYLRRVLEEMAADEGRTIDRLEILPEAERRLVVEEWNRTEAEHPRGVCLHEMFESRAEAAPHAVAIVAGEREVTYAELNAKANRLAHHLRGRGVRPDARVAVCLERSPEMVAGLLAVLKAGGAYVPLDPAHPQDRLRGMLDDSRPVAVLTQSSLRSRFADAGIPVVEVDDAAAWAGEPVSNPPRDGLVAENLAYLIYTSGSTGRPKGVMIEHAQVVRQIAAARELFALAPGDRSLQFASVTFDVSVEEIFAALSSGSAILLRGDDWLEGAEGFWARCERFGATVLDLPPRFWQLLVANPAPVPACVRLVVVGGEAVDLPSISAWFGRDGHRPRLLNLYGPTEATVNATGQALTDDPSTWHSIGRPLANTRAYVLDALGQPLPVGVTGEIHLAGGQVARGYLGRPAITAERFVPDPFSADGGRMYRTGDLGRWRADGTLEFVGRNDFQVKIRGFRIEPGEVEARLSAHPGVRQAVVVAREDTPGDRRLVAYYVGFEGDAQALRAHLAAELPEYMVPAAYVRMDELPLTSSGKVDRGALPAPGGDAFVRRGWEAPVGATETELAEIWAELLGVARVGRWDNFFELGGHSLLAVRLIERMRRRGLHAEVRAIFTTPTLAELATAVGAESHEAAVPANLIPAGAEAITPEMLPLVQLTQAEIDRVLAGVEGGAANVQDIYPLAPLQEGMLFHNVMATEGDPYVLPALSAFDTREAVDAHLAALQTVIDRHDILRTSVAWEGVHEPVQVVWRKATLGVEEVELDPAAGEVARQLFARFDPRRTRLDVRRAPLMRACVARDEERGRWLLLLLEHHLVGDHTTNEVIAEEVGALLAGRGHELPAPLPFRNFVAQTRLGIERGEHEAYFRALLGNVDEPTAPFGLLDAWGDGSGIADARVALDSGVAARLRERARRLGVSAASVCHVAWTQVLARVSGRADVVSGTVLFGRMQGGEGADRVLGPFINTLPVRARVGAEGAEEAVRSMHRQLAELLRHEHASLALAQRCSRVEAPAPLFTAVFSFRHSGDAPRAAGGAAAEGGRRIFGQERTNYPVTVYVDDRGEGFGIKVQVPASAGPERVCAMMQRAIEGLVDALENEPGRPLSRIPVLPDDERRRVVEEWNRTDAAYPAGVCVHRLFEAQVARTPDATAVSFDGGSISYAELNARANRLAHELAARGVRPDTRVALCLERGAEMVVAVLAVLKAGGAYVPIDPAYPEERLRYMLEDSAPAALLTQASLAGRFVGLAIPVLAMDADASTWAGRSTEDPEVAGLTAEHLAYVIYTSGSTGRPKGVMVRHDGVTNYVTYARARYVGEGAGDFPLYSSLSFDLTVTSIFVPLASGGRIAVAPNESGDRTIPRVFDENATDVVKLTPAHLVLLAQRDLRGSRIRRLVVGGEDLKAPLARQVHEASGGGMEIWNEYGPTEATVGCVVHRYDAEHDTDASVPIGRPIANHRVYVLDADGEPVPAGVVGELYIGGAGVARGYLGRPRLTAERFVPDAFGGRPGARLYRTGDLARWRESAEVRECGSALDPRETERTDALSHSRTGILEFLGRGDDQVKVRGYRIELGEIEAGLLEHPGVREAVVLAREDEPGDTRLVAYCVGDADAEALRAHLGERLPEYMVPAAYVRLEALPLTPNGKVDRRALPAPDGEAFARSRWAAPEGETETVLAEIWAELLGVERVGRHDNFFELGGHSLLVLRLIQRMRKRGLHVGGQALFMTPTLSGMAALVGGEQKPEVVVPPNLIPTPAATAPAAGGDTVELIL